MRSILPTAMYEAAARFFAGPGVIVCLVLIAGWVLQGPGPVNPFGGQYPVPTCLAVSTFLICAANLLRKQVVAARVLAVTSGIPAALTLVQYALRIDLGLDQLFLTGGPLQATGTPGRMAFATAGALVMLSTSTIFLTVRRLRPMGLASALSAAILASVLTTEALLQQDIGNDLAFYSPLTNISPLSAGLVYLLTVVTVSRALARWTEVQVDRVDHLQAWCVMVAATGIIVGWTHLERTDWQRWSYETHLVRESVLNNLSFQLSQRGLLQQRLASRWNIYGPPTQEQWIEDAKAALNDLPGLFALAYASPDRVSRWRVSVDGNNEGYLGVALDGDAVRKAAFDAADATRTLAMTPSVTQVSGAKGHLFITPIIVNAKRLGYLVASIRANTLANLVKGPTVEGFGIRITDSNGTVAASDLAPSGLGADIVKVGTITVLGKVWSVEVWPTDAYIATWRSRLPEQTLVFGLIILGLIFISFSQSRNVGRIRSQAESLSGRLADTLERITDAYAMVDRNWTIVQTNRLTAETLGCASVPVLGRSFHAVFGLSADSEQARALDQAMAGTGAATLEFLHEQSGRWLLLTAHPTPEGLSAFFRDVSEARARADQLRLLEFAISRQNDGLIIAEVQPRAPGKGPYTPIVYVNEAFERITGYSRDEVIGKTPQLLRGPRTDAVELQRITAAISEGKPVRGELLNYAKDGRECWIEIDVVPLPDAVGKLTHFVAVERDITQRKETEAALRLSEERFRLVVDASNDVIWDCDLQTGEVWYNDRMRSLFGYYFTETGPTQADWFSQIHADDQPEVKRQMEATLASGSMFGRLEYRFCKADGQHANIVELYRIIRNDDGKAIRTIGTMVDVTERLLMDKRLEQSQRLEAVGKLTGGIAHDFNNLLTIILGNAELLGERLQDQPALRRMADMTASAAARGASLTGHLLAFARRQPLNPKVIDAAGLIREMEPLLQRTLPENTELEITAVCRSLEIEVDATQLESAILNLALNARDAMPGGGTLTISATERIVTTQDIDHLPDAIPGAYVVVSVIDNGSGMASDILSRAFEPFFTTKETGRGSGLGLSMVYGFVRQSSGFARIESEPGKGTGVSLFFPRAATPPTPAIRSEAIVEISGGREHILVVEDDELVRESVVDQLSRLGYRITAAANGVAALDVLKAEEDIDLLFTDVMMPGKYNGRDLAAAAAKIRPGMKILFTSGYSEAAISRNGRLDQGISLLTKPYRHQQLSQKIREVLR